MSWNPYITSPTILVGADILIDLTGVTIYTSAPDALKYSYRAMSSDPPGTEGGAVPNYEIDKYAFYSQYGYTTAIEGSTPSYLTSSPGSLHRMYSAIVPTHYPSIESSGETAGLMKYDRPFKYSWSKSIYSYGHDGLLDEGTGDVDPEITGFYGNWSIVDDYYLNSILSSPYYFPTLVVNTQAHIAGFGLFEIMKSSRVRNNAPRTLDGVIVSPTHFRGDYGDLYDGATLTDEQALSATWPEMSVLEESADHHSRDYRKNHVGITVKFDVYPSVHQDLYERYYHRNYNNQKRDNYINNRISALETMLEIAENLPKEYRIRTQPQVKMELSQLSYFPIMGETSTPETTPTTSTSTMGSTRGSDAY